MPSSLHLLTADETNSLTPADAAQMERTLESSMQRLQAACDAHGRADRRLETACCNLAWRVARLLVDADMAGVRMPRGYVARTRSSEPYLEKYAEVGDGTSTGHSELVMLLTRKGSIVARMEPAARKLTYSLVLEFQRDVEEGLLDEIAHFIETRGHQEERSAAQLDSLLPGAPRARRAAHRATRTTR